MISGIGRLAAGVLFSLALSAGAATAQSQSDALKVAREVVDVSGVADTLKDIVPIFLDEGKRTFIRTQPDLANDLDDSVKTLLPEFQKRKEQLLNDIASTYVDRFTVEELKAIRDFYASPAGVKLVKIQPSVLEASYDKTNAWSRQMSQDVIAKLREEMKKKGHDI